MGNMLNTYYCVSIMFPSLLNNVCGVLPQQLAHPLSIIFIQREFYTTNSLPPSLHFHITFKKKHQNFLLWKRRSSSETNLSACLFFPLFFFYLTLRVFFSSFSLSFFSLSSQLSHFQLPIRIFSYHFSA